MGFHQYHKVEEREYEITYVLSGWGIKEDYVVFGIKEIKQKILSKAKFKAITTKSDN